MLKLQLYRISYIAHLPAAFRRLCVETDNSLYPFSFLASQPPSGGCVLKHIRIDERSYKEPQPPSGGCVLKPTSLPAFVYSFGSQPPSGGCVLKRYILMMVSRFLTQPPSGGCVLKQDMHVWLKWPENQPPSGGCVLKQRTGGRMIKIDAPAAFRRLCVETGIRVSASPHRANQPPSGGCVLKHFVIACVVVGIDASRLQAAVC